MKPSLLLLCFICVSCSVAELFYHYPDEVNHRLLSRLEKKYIRENGNCFHLTSTYSRYAVIWHYTENAIVINHLKNGRISKTEQYVSDGLSIINTLAIDSASFLQDDGWVWALDGDGLKISLRNREYVFNLAISYVESLKYESKTPLSKFIKEELLRYHIFQ